MDVLRPRLRWIGGRCYREYGDLENDGIKNVELEDDYSVDTIPAYYDVDGATCDADVEIEELGVNRFQATVSVPAVLLGVVIGKGGASKKRIEESTRTTLKIPNKGVEDDIVIDGSTRSGVALAKTKIKSIVDSARRREEFTHFISIPMTDQNVLLGYEKFKCQVMERFSSARGITEELFQNPAKMHLTIGTLTLLNDNERQHAACLLKDIGENVVRNVVGKNPLEVVVRGIEYMNDDPSEANVLYAKVETLNEDRLQVLADQIMQGFVDDGVMEPPRSSSVKIHLTIMNNKFLNTIDPTGHRPLRSPRKPFDAKGVLEGFKDFVFGSCTLTSIQLSQRHTVGSDGYYKCSGKVDI